MFCSECSRKKYKPNRCDYCYRKKRQEKAPKIICKCGCGEIIPSISYDNKPQFYKHGHGNTGTKNNFWRGGVHYDQHGYLDIKLRKHHPYKTKSGYVKLHRLVMEKYIGRYLLPEEIVHHINGIKTDNRKCNLMLVSREEHLRIHMTKDMSDRVCYKCNEKTRIKPNGNEDWYRDKYNKNWICYKCYMKNYRERRMS